MIDILSIQKEIGKKYGIGWTRAEEWQLTPNQIETLCHMRDMLDFSKEENVRAYLEQKAIFLSSKK